MQVLIVHAHPEPRSFTAALRDRAVETLQQAGHEVVVSDLYVQGFNPVASAADFSQRRNPDYLVYALEQRHALETGSLPADVKAELAKVEVADLLILTFPIFWFSMPAMLKGWIDRVFLAGRFYGGRRIYGKGGLAGKRALIGVTLGGREHMFGPGALHGELAGMLRHLLQGTLGYVGLQVLESFFAYHVPYVDADSRSDMLAAWQAHLVRLDELKVLPMPKLESFDESFRPLA